MKTRELDYDLPRELIAQQPVRVRSDSRLLVFDRSNGVLIDSHFHKLGAFLSAGDCLVLNDTKVLPARFFGRRGSGGRLEGLFLAECEAGVWEVILKGSGKLKVGETICLKDTEKGDFCTAEVLEKLGQGKWRLKLGGEASLEAVLEKIGYPPLPPYIKRGDDAGEAAVDRLRYQTVYARRAGAVAAPTAGLHFTDELMGQLKERGIRFAYITLHIGLGTFKLITAEAVEEHKMEREWFSIDAENAEVINSTKEKGGQIIAVGTTSVRALETAAAPSKFEVVTPPGSMCRRSRLSGRRIPFNGVSGETGLFIKPGYKFKMIDAMVTNFHLPRSTLLALVGAFAGMENILAAYRHAVEQRYQFYSYGDAMLIV